MELLHFQGPKNNILAVGDYLRADVPFEGKNDNFDPSSKFYRKMRSTAKCRISCFFIFMSACNSSN
jgi:hypothetical protein